MSRRSKLLFLVLVIAQAAHSVEEYITRLYEVFAPARIVSGMVSGNLAEGFVFVNIVLVLTGVLCYFGPVRHGGSAGRLVAALWVALELANGLGHLAIAASRGGYFSGSLTAVVLAVTAAGLALSLSADRGVQP